MRHRAYGDPRPTAADTFIRALEILWGTAWIAAFLGGIAYIGWTEVGWWALLALAFPTLIWLLSLGQSGDYRGP